MTVLHNINLSYTSHFLNGVQSENVDKTIVYYIINKQLKIENKITLAVVKLEAKLKCNVVYRFVCMPTALQPCASAAACRRVL